MRRLSTKALQRTLRAQSTKPACRLQEKTEQFRPSCRQESSIFPDPGSLYACRHLCEVVAPLQVIRNISNFSLYTLIKDEAVGKCKQYHALVTYS